MARRRSAESNGATEGPRVPAFIQGPDDAPGQIVEIAGRRFQADEAGALVPRVP